MNVRVTKFDRDYEGSSAVVGFYVRHPTYDTGIFVDFAVPMSGTDADMSAAAWAGVLPRVVAWVAEVTARRSSSLVGTVFTANVPVAVEETPVVAEETPVAVEETPVVVEETA